jgi:hypothetical protein
MGGNKLHYEVDGRGSAGEFRRHRPLLESCRVYRRATNYLGIYANSVNIYALCERTAPSMPCFREINPTVYSVTEFTRKRASKDHFLSQVLTSPRLI